MRAGLLSEPRVIQRIHDRFVSTWILKDDLATLAKKGDPLAQQLAPNFEEPLDLMFLTPGGRFISKLSSFHDFTEVHPDVGAPNFITSTRKEQKRKQSHADVFLEYTAAHFGGD